MQRQKSPNRPVRLHRFASPPPHWARALWRRAQRLPVVVPLCAGFTMAGVINAAWPTAMVPTAPVAATPPLETGAESAVAPDGKTAPADAPTARASTLASATVTAHAAGPSTTAALLAPSSTPSAPAPKSTTAPVPSAVKVTTPASAATNVDAPHSTRDPKLEAALRTILQQGQTPYGAVVVMEAATGRIVAIAEHSTRGSAESLALRPIAPAASVFKVVTTSALLEAGVPADEKVCFHGGKTRMSPKLLQDSRRDNTCVTLGDVIPKSANVAAAKLATLHLTPEQLRDHARRWGFGQTLGIKGLQPSTARIPDEAFAFAEAAAGFGDVKLSAMHGAVLAAVVANGGQLVTPTTSLEHAPQHTRVIDATAARALRRMMTETVSSGTGRRAFRQGPALGVSAAGKTGSLTDYSTGLDSSWFVGFAPADAPEYVVSAVVVNTAKWHIKAPWLAKESLRLTLANRGGSHKKGPRVAAR
jgi:penicillin-binding protein A